MEVGRGFTAVQFGGPIFGLFRRGQILFQLTRQAAALHLHNDEGGQSKGLGGQQNEICQSQLVLVPSQDDRGRGFELMIHAALGCASN